MAEWWDPANQALLPIARWEQLGDVEELEEDALRFAAHSTAAVVGSAQRGAGSVAPTAADHALRRHSGGEIGDPGMRNNEARVETFEQYRRRTADARWQCHSGSRGDADTVAAQHQQQLQHRDAIVLSKQAGREHRVPALPEELRDGTNAACSPGSAPAAPHGWLRPRPSSGVIVGCDALRPPPSLWRVQAGDPADRCAPGQPPMDDDSGAASEAAPIVQAVHTPRRPANRTQAGVVYLVRPASARAKLYRRAGTGEGALHLRPANTQDATGLPPGSSSSGSGCGNSSGSSSLSVQQEPRSVAARACSPPGSAGRARSPLRAMGAAAAHRHAALDGPALPNDVPATHPVPRPARPFSATAATAAAEAAALGCTAGSSVRETQQRRRPRSAALVRETPHARQQPVHPSRRAQAGPSLVVDRPASGSYSAMGRFMDATLALTAAAGRRPCGSRATRGAPPSPRPQPRRPGGAAAGSNGSGNETGALQALVRALEEPPAAPSAKLRPPSPSKQVRTAAAQPVRAQAGGNRARPASAAAVPAAGATRRVACTLPTRRPPSAHAAVASLSRAPGQRVVPGGPGPAAEARLEPDAERGVGEAGAAAALPSSNAAGTGKRTSWQVEPSFSQLVMRLFGANNLDPRTKPGPAVGGVTVFKDPFAYSAAEGAAAAAGDSAQQDAGDAESEHECEITEADETSRASKLVVWNGRRVMVPPSLLKKITRARRELAMKQRSHPRHAPSRTAAGQQPARRPRAERTALSNPRGVVTTGRREDEGEGDSEGDAQSRSKLVRRLHKTLSRARSEMELAD